VKLYPVQELYPKGRQKRRKQNQCTYRLCSAWICFKRTYDVVIFLIAFLSSPYRRTPKNTTKQIRQGG
jgi:hypothetical protein